MPPFSSQAMAALISGRRPSNSRQTMPISSVTLAWRTLVMTLNFWPNSQTTGRVISRGGYINHSRVFWGAVLKEVSTVGDFLVARGIWSEIEDLKSRRRGLDNAHRGSGSVRQTFHVQSSTRRGTMAQSHQPTQDARMLGKKPPDSHPSLTRDPKTQWD